MVRAYSVLLCRAKFYGQKLYRLVLVCLLKISVATVGGAKMLNIAHRVGLYGSVLAANEDAPLRIEVFGNAIYGASVGQAHAHAGSEGCGGGACLVEQADALWVEGVGVEGVGAFGVTAGAHEGAVAAGEDAQESGEHLGGVDDLPGAQAQAGGGGYGQLFSGHVRVLADTHNDAALPLGGAAFGNELGEDSAALSPLRDDVIGPFEGGIHAVAAPNIDHAEPGDEGQPVVAVFG